MAGPGWHIQQGQALWRPERGLPELAGDLLLVWNPDGRCLLRFDKTPLPMVFVQLTPTRWLIRFPQRNMGFSGYGPGPPRFAWLYLPAALAGKAIPAPLHFERKSDGHWQLVNPSTGEVIDGFLSP